MTEPVPMGAENETQRVCSRLLGVNDGRETLCGEPATVHVIYRWDTDGYDHGFCCPDHWREYVLRWQCAGYHMVNDVCGMPGTRIHPERPCEFEGLETAEPVRAIAVPVPVGGEA